MNTNWTQTAVSGLKLGVSAAALLGIMGACGAAFAQNEATETVVVTGFRESLEKALDLKRAAVGASDSILAEDIAKFPDFDVAESLQRIPGINITREAGEGREITVRGLGAQFTRVRINGMEALATGGGEDANESIGNAGVNRGRGFDFNVFASELFSQLTVRKSNAADVEEGSLGATVDMHTARPFDFPGFVFTASAKAGYWDMAETTSPRFAALVSDTFLGGRLGFLVSAAYATSNILEEGVSDIRTATGVPFGKVNGATSGGVGTDFDTVNNILYHPRAPRYDLITVKDHRLGLTASVQWQPEDGTLFTLDAVYADFAQIRDESYMQAYSLNQNSVTGSAVKYPQVSSGTVCRFYGETCTSTLLTEFQLGNKYSSLWNYDASDVDTARNFLQRAELSNVGIRSQHRLDHLDTRFMQVTVEGTHSFSEEFKIHVLGGWSESHHRNPIQETLSADYGCKFTGSASSCPAGTAGDGTQNDPYIYDYSPGPMPLLNYGGLDVTEPSAGWFFNILSGRATFQYNSYRTAQGDFEWSPISEIKVEGGVNYRNYGYNSVSMRRSNGTNTGLDGVIPYPIASADLNDYAMVKTLRNIDVPSVNGVNPTLSWWVIDINKFNSDFHYLDPTAYPFTNSYSTGRCKNSGAASAAGNCGAFQLGPETDIGSNGTVREDDYGGYLQVDWDTTIADMPYRGNIGVRYVLTETASAGYTYDALNKVILPIDPIPNTYHDWLPSVNMVFEPTKFVENFLIRFNASYAMTRPSLSSMLPSGAPTVSGQQAGYSVGNPKLPPMRSKNIDLAFEWYYSKGAMISVAGFWKHLDNVVMTQTETWANFAANTLGLTDPTAFAAACGMTLADWNAGLPGTGGCTGGRDGTQWKYSRPVNQKGSPLKGAEINWQQPLDFLPHPFDSFGVLGNFTYVEAQQQYPGVSGFYTADLQGLSRVSYNGTFYYDDGTLQARITGAFRSHWLSDPAVNTGNEGIYSKSKFNLDASASYKYNENLMLTFDALNITNQAMELYTDATYQRPYVYHETGSTYFVGVKYSY